ncbi:hypothetical protein [Mesorhizobium sp. LjRoot246]|uniref:hypothetical protein n=1 Tax=Mesorhizobium sp. LjRoot246 TaxID=3342294 RepID=UPI003ECF29D7
MIIPSDDQEAQSIITEIKAILAELSAIDVRTDLAQWMALEQRHHELVGKLYERRIDRPS